MQHLPATLSEKSLNYRLLQNVRLMLFFLAEQTGLPAIRFRSAAFPAA
jgi:hypothetical protein